MRTTRKLKIVSNNKVRANRENAKKSTGQALIVLADFEDLILSKVSNSIELRSLTKFDINFR